MVLLHGSTTKLSPLFSQGKAKVWEILEWILCSFRGGLRHLAEIVILRSYELTMAAVTQLILACPRLRLLGEIDGWEGVSLGDVADLRDKIKTNNWDLDIDCTWSGH